MKTNQFYKQLVKEMKHSVEIHLALECYDKEIEVIKENKDHYCECPDVCEMSDSEFLKWLESKCS